MFTVHFNKIVTNLKVRVLYLTSCPDSISSPTLSLVIKHFFKTETILGMSPWRDDDDEWIVYFFVYKYLSALSWPYFSMAVKQSVTMMRIAQIWKRLLNLIQM